MMVHRANDDLKALVRTIPDYPKPGIMFRDITTLLLDGPGFAASIARMAASLTTPPDLIAGIEARGFIFGAALAREFGVGLVLLRKQNKLPGQVTGVNLLRSSGYARLDAAAIAFALKRWRFEAALEIGKPVAASRRFTIRFNLSEAG
jgi:adenine phosphoribosyltransferase